MLSPFLSVAAILLGIAIAALGQGILGTLVPLRLARAGVAADIAGLVITANAVGFLVGCLFGARAIRLVGHIRAFSAFAAASCLAALALPWQVDAALWAALRFAMGICSAGLFMIAESWLNELTPRPLRGRILTTYVVAVMAAWGSGQLLLTVLDPADPFSFTIAAGAYCLALIPVTLTRSRHPSVPRTIRLDPLQVWRTSPVGAVGCVTVGLISATVIAVAPLWAAARGYPTAAIATLLAATQIGGLACQWPLGWLSDRIDRRLVIVGAAAAVALLSLAVGVVGGASFALLVVLFALWGGAAEAIYPIAVAHANDHAKPQDYVPLSGSLLVLWALGSAIGPLVATGAMERLGPDALFGYAALLAALFAAFVVWRMQRRGRVPAAEAEQFVGLSTFGSPATAELDPRIRPEHEASDEPGYDDTDDVPEGVIGGQRLGPP